MEVWWKVRPVASTGYPVPEEVVVASSAKKQAVRLQPTGNLDLLRNVEASAVIHKPSSSIITPFGMRVEHPMSTTESPGESC